MQTNPNGSWAEPCNLRHFFVRQTLHISQDKNNSILLREFVNCLS